MSATSDAAKQVSAALLGGLAMPAPSGHTTKTINGKSQTVSAKEAWTHASVDQTDPGTIKTFLHAVSNEYAKRGDTSRAQAALLQATLF